MVGPILVFGRNGQVARELAAVAGDRALVFAGRETLDLANAETAAGAIDALLAEASPSAVINAAAYTTVDRAEREAQTAFAVNRDAPATMARSCAARSLPLVHFSTDYVFDGTLDRPYVEADPTGPTSVYGASKLAGEQAVTAAGGSAIILRTAWVYSAHGTNFVKTMLRLAADRDEVSVVVDQVGRPTWARDVARAALLAVDGLRRDPALAGLYHLSGPDDASWADLAAETFALSARRGGPTAQVRPITSDEYPTPARRPANSRLDCGKIQTALAWRGRPWRESLAACMNEMELQHP